MKHQSFSSYYVQIALVIITGIFLGYVYITSTTLVYSMNSCQSINYSEDVIRGGYGSPFNFFSIVPELAIQVLCSEEGAQLTVGTGNEKEYILDYALQRVDGKWKHIELTGDKKVGRWYLGSAKALFEKDTLKEGKTTRIAAYVCQKIEGIWKCGCRDKVCATPYWQIQEFTFDEMDTTLDDNEISDENEAYLTPSTPDIGPSGTKVVLTGEGLSKSNNTVLFDDEVVAEDVSSADGKSVAFTIPSTITSGYKRISLVTDTGEEVPGVSFIVTVPGVEKPTVTSITPQNGKPGTEVTVYGKNFSKEGNDILIGFDVLHGVASKDGSSLTFNLDPLKNLSSVEGFSKMEGEMPIHIVVVNGGGASEEALFTMEF